ncbi:MAG: hypothetical protein MJ211_05085 [Bacteroidales bacterium]|nr:hypothetical protein [Bacteroidales bacterium]
MKELNIIEMQNIEAGDSCTTAYILWGFTIVGLCIASGGIGAVCAIGGYGAASASIAYYCA